MIERYDPFRRLMTLPQVMDRLFEDAVVIPREGQAARAAMPAVNVYEEGDNLIVEAELPGLKPEDIDVTVEGGTLTIRGETKTDEERKERNYFVREHRRTSFVRSLRLPDTIDAGSARAAFENGILRLTFPKSAHAKPRRITVTSEGQKAQGGNGKTGSRAKNETGSKETVETGRY